MTLISLALWATTARADDGAVFTTELRSTAGEVAPAVLLAVPPPDPSADPPDPDADPPEPDYGTDGRTAFGALRFEGTSDHGVLVAVAEPRLGVRELYVVEDDGDRVVVWGPGAVERFFPPDPCGTDGYPPDPCRVLLPPGPCFELVAVLGDGTELGVWISIAADGGFVDPGSLVGFNPQPDPPREFPAAIELDFTAFARGAATLEVTILLESGGELLPLR